MTMTAKVSLRELVDEMETLCDEHTAFLNRKTGKPITLTEEDIAILEGDAPDFVPDWQAEFLNTVRPAYEADDLLALPSRFEIDEYSIMREFCQSATNPAHRAELLDAIHGAGAFRRFKRVCEHVDLSDAWYRFRDEALEEIAVEWLEANGIPFHRDSRDSDRST